MGRRVLGTMVTTTTYGTWLPGDLRGYVQNGTILPPNPLLLQHAQTLLAQEPVTFTDAEQGQLLGALCAAAREFGYPLTDVSIESWHLHWLIDQGFDSTDVMVGRLKTRMRQALGRGRIWTAGYWQRYLHTEAEVATARQYIAKHAGCRMINGELVHCPTRSDR